MSMRFSHADPSDHLRHHRLTVETMTFLVSASSLMTTTTTAASANDDSLFLLEEWEERCEGKRRVCLFRYYGLDDGRAAVRAG